MSPTSVRLTWLTTCHSWPGAERAMPSRRLVTLFAVGVAALAAAVLITGTRGAVRRLAPPLPRQVLTPPPVTLASLRGKPALINFWASWCHPCQEEAPRLQRFAAGLGGRGRL